MASLFRFENKNAFISIFIWCLHLKEIACSTYLYLFKSLFKCFLSILNNTIKCNVFQRCVALNHHKKFILMTKVWFLEVVYGSHLSHGFQICHSILIEEPSILIEKSCLLMSKTYFYQIQKSRFSIAYIDKSGFLIEKPAFLIKRSEIPYLYYQSLFNCRRWDHAFSPSSSFRAR